MGSTRGEPPAESLASRFERLWDATGTAPELNAFLQLHPDAGLRERAAREGGPASSGMDASTWPRSAGSASPR
jgi:hypothetical protein